MVLEICFEKIDKNNFFNDKEVLIKQLFEEIKKYEKVDPEKCIVGPTGIIYFCHTKTGVVEVVFVYDSKSKQFCAKVERK